MKKLFLVLAAAFAMVACQTDINEVGVVAEGVATVEFEVGAPQMRSFSDGMTATVLQYAVYDAQGEELSDLRKEAVELVNGRANVKIELANNKSYSIIFWAEAEGAPYTFNFAEKTVTVDYTNAECNDELRDAFYAYKPFEVKGAATLGVELRRPFAQVNVGTSDLALAAKSNFVPSTSALVVEDVFSTLNLVDGTALGNTTDVTFAATTVPAGEEFKVAGHDYLAMSYVLVGKDKGSYDVTYTITAEDTTVITNTIGAVPMQANYRTNIYGKLLTSTTDINVDINPDYNLPNDDVTPSVEINGVSYNSIESAIEDIEDGVATVIELSKNIVVESPIVIPVGKVVTIDLKGYSLAVADAEVSRATNVTTYAINNHGTLTLKNGEVYARGIYNGYNPEGEPVATAKLTIENGTYNALGTNGGACVFNYGEVVINNGTFTSIGGYSLNTQAGSKMTINNATVTGGIYSEGELTINNGKIKTNRGGYTHAIYHAGDTLTIYAGEFEGNGNEVINANSSKALIYGGTFKKVEKTSYLLAGSKMTIFDGTFYAHESNPAGHPVRPDVTIMGGTFNYNVGQINKPKNSTVTDNGDGTWSVSVNDYWQEGDNYYIATAAGLKWFADNVNTMEFYVNAAANIFDNKTVYLAKNIDLAGAEWTPIGDYAFSRTIFRGVFDGQGYTISNFKITEPVRWTEKATEAAYGLFGNVKGTIKNLTVKNATVAPQGGRYSAVLVGRLHNGGVIENCHVVNSSATILHWQVGALVGQNNNGNISNCSVVGSTVTGKAAVGAIVGMDMIAGEHSITNCRVANTALVQNESFGASYDASYGLIVGLANASGIILHIDNAVVENNTIQGVAADTLVGNKEAGVTVLVDGTIVVATADELNAAVASNVTVTITADIEGGSLKLPANLSNFTLRAANGATLKNFTISAADGNAYHYENLTFDGLTFDNSRIVLTGWRNGVETLKNLTITNCVFQNLDDTTSEAPVHINKEAAEAVENFTFTNNVINGATGGSKSGVYAQVTGNVVFENNVINNVSFRPYVIQVTTNDGIADSFSVKGNTFSGSSKGRAQGLGNNAEGTDAVQLIVSGNIFKDITEAQQICYWNFNAATTTADLSKNYYSIDIEANPSGIYYNAAANSVEDLKAMGVYPYYTELNADGTINLNSLKQAE